MANAPKAGTRKKSLKRKGWTNRRSRTWKRMLAGSALAVNHSLLTAMLKGNSDRAEGSPARVQQAQIARDFP